MVVLNLIISLQFSLYLVDVGLRCHEPLNVRFQQLFASWYSFSVLKQEEQLAMSQAISSTFGLISTDHESNF